MKNIMKLKNLLLMAVIGFVFAVCIPAVAGHADEDRVTLKTGTVTNDGVNVREGPGSEAYSVMQYNGAKVQLTRGMTVIIIGEQEVNDSNGQKIWYHINFYKGDVLLDGWVTSSYITISGTVTSTPTPTPEVTNTPTPGPTDTPTPVPSDTPTPTPAITQPEQINSNSSIYKLFWKIVIAVLVIAVVIIIIIYAYNKFSYSQNKNSEMNKKMKYLKNIDVEDGSSKKDVTTAKRPEVRVVSDENGEEVRNDAEETDERAELRARLDRLKQHDIITHKYFGKGEVYDNSDVKLMEVRFGMDVRYLNKDSLAAKKLLTFDEDETLPTKRKL